MGQSSVVRPIVLCTVGLALVCGCPASETPPDDPATCGEPGSALAGVSYDVGRSRFAFGSSPQKSEEGGLTRWSGKDGVLVIDALGHANARMNAGAEAAQRPDWSSPSDPLDSHVRDYFVAMGVPRCQVLELSGTTSIGGGASHSTLGLARAVDGIRVVDSSALARINDGDQSTFESFYWPTIPAEVVTEARALRDQLADPTQRAAYEAKLPADARGEGSVVIRHTNMPFGTTFRAQATWSTTLQNGESASFDRDGSRTPW